MATEFDKGFLVGVLVGEGHFGGDGRQPQVTLRMHVRHEGLFNWIERVFPGGKLYGPYNHDGRRYYQWMARGSYLRDVLMPILDEYLTAQMDAAGAERYDEMKSRYRSRLRRRGEAVVEDEAVRAPAAEPDDSQKPERGQPSLRGSTAVEIFDRLRRERPL